MLRPSLAALAKRTVWPVSLRSVKPVTSHHRQYSTPSADEDTPPVTRVPHRSRGNTYNASSKPVKISIAGREHSFAGSYLRDLCKCERCRDPSTRQKLELTTRVRGSVSPSSVDVHGDSISILWDEKSENVDRHVTELPLETLARLAGLSSDGRMPDLPQRKLWLDEDFRNETTDIPYDAYMQDDSTLLTALRQLQTHGLVFLTEVPGSPESVARIAERIGPLKNTFYGMTWDVRSVPAAKNVAYTSQNLGFHMDLLYMRQPPHLQFLHCIRSSAEGGASLFSDTYRAVQTLYTRHPRHAQTLTEVNVPYHYDHADAEPLGHYYQHSHPVIALKPLHFTKSGNEPTTATFSHLNLLKRQAGQGNRAWALDQLNNNFAAWVESVAWSPPFQAPFAAPSFAGVTANPVTALEQGFASWRKAAIAFDMTLHRREAIHERLMKPGECVLFDNTRIVHARKAFVPGDEGSERWLRGAYVDRDPYESRLKVLLKKEMEEKGSMDELGAPHWLPDAV